jgi:hypothetical protein
MRLNADSEAEDALQAMAARRRELPLLLVSEQPLRKPKGRKQVRAMALLRDELLAQIDRQMRRARRRAFRGEVAVEISLAHSRERSDTGLKPMVKAYLDVLGESAFFDDAKVEHLITQRSLSRSDKTEVTIRCLPLSVFAANFDRSFRVDGELALIDPDAHPQTVPWGLRHFDEHDRWQLGYTRGILATVEELDRAEEEAFARGEEDEFYPEVSDSNRELTDPQLRESLGPELRENIARSLGSMLTDQGFDARDRPGPPPGWLEEVVADDLGEVERLSTDHPGCFSLPLPPQRPRGGDEPEWSLELARGFYSRYSSPWEWGTARFGGALALDIGLRGGAGTQNDIDNVAHKVIGAFQQVFVKSVPNVSGYRAYKLSSGDPELRVRVLPAIRLQLLQRSLDQARELVLAERAERRRS